MDPLSITVSIVSLIDVAKRMKDAVDKIKQNRRALQELVSALVDELAELQKLCQDRGNTFDKVNLDHDSTHSLQQLKLELDNVLQHCLKLVECRQHRCFAFARSYINAWIKNGQIEAAIIRLRDSVSSIHRRFTIVSFRRAEQMENNMLVVGTENQVMLRRLEVSMSQLLVRSHASSSYPASLLDRASPGSLEYQFLRLQVLKTVNGLYHVSATHQLLNTAHNGLSGVGIRVTLVPSQPSLMRSATVEALQMQQLLELQPSHLFTPEGANQLRRLAHQLYYLDLNEDSLSIATWMTPVYRTLMRQNPIYKPHVAWGHENFSKSRMGTLEGLDCAKSAVDIYEEMVDVSLSYSLSLALSKVALGLQYFATGDYDKFCESTKEALAIHRKIPGQSPDSGTLVVWEAPREDRPIISSAHPVSRSYPMAITEGWCLRTYALSLATTGRYSEALAVGAEAINCFNAIIRCRPGHHFPKKALEHLLEHHNTWVSCFSQPVQRPAGASVSGVEDPYSADDGEDVEEHGPSANDVTINKPMVVVRPFDLYYLTGIDLGLLRVMD